MIRFITLIVATALISSCALFNKPVEIKTEIQKVNVPLLYCPAPPDITRPRLEINELTDAQAVVDGELAKAYAASMVQLIGYVEELEQAVGMYDSTNEAYDELRKRFERDFTENQKSGDRE